MEKALFITHVGDPGGAEVKMLHLAGAENEHAEVLYMQTGTLREHLERRGIKGQLLEMPKGLTGFRREDGLLKAFTQVPAVIKMLGALAKTCRQYDVVVCMSQKSFMMVALSYVFIRRPVIWFMNDIVTKEHFNPRLIRIMTALGRYVARAVVVNSQASKTAWLAAGGDEGNTHILYPCIDFEEFEAANKEDAQAIRQRYSPDDKPLIGMFGRITKWKGQEVFIKAISRLPEARGMIVGEAYFGEEKYLEYLKELVASLGLQGRVFFTGHVNNVNAYMTACDVIAHCSTSPEPFGQVIVQGMASKKPVVAAADGGALEIIEDGVCGLLSQPGDDGELAEKISFYLDHPDKARLIAEQGYESAKARFSVKSIVQDYRKICAGLNIRG